MRNLLDIAGISKTRNTYLVRQERIKREGSPYYSWAVPVTAAGASSAIYVPTQFPDGKKYHPLDWLEICNNDTNCNLTLTINGNTTLPVPSGTIRTIENKALHHIAIKNDGAVATAANKIICSLQRQPLTMDKWVRSQR